MIAAMQIVPKTPPHGRALKLHRNAGFGEVSNIALQPQTRMNRALPQTGTALAKEYLFLWCATRFGLQSNRPGRSAQQRKAREP